MNTANAKELELGRGVKAEAARRLNKSPQWIGEAWAREVPYVVEMVLDVREEFIKEKARIKARIMRSSKLAEQEIIEKHLADQDLTFGPEYETFKK